jgi:hypothetical protein
MLSRYVLLLTLSSLRLTRPPLKQRPYAAKISGIPLSAKYEMKTRAYSFRYANPTSPLTTRARRAQADATTDDPPVVGETPRARETEIYLPRRRYGDAAREGRLRVAVEKGDGEWKYDVEVSSSRTLVPFQCVELILMVGACDFFRDRLFISFIRTSNRASFIRSR